MNTVYSLDWDLAIIRKNIVLRISCNIFLVQLFSVFALLWIHQKQKLLTRYWMNRHKLLDSPLSPGCVLGLGKLLLVRTELCGTTTNNNKETGSLLTLKVGCGVGRVKYIFPHIVWTKFYFFWWEETKITFLIKKSEFIWFLDTWKECLHSLSKYFFRILM